MILLKMGLSLIIGYVIGSISFGFVLVKVITRKNIFTLGNKRCGAANVFREIGKTMGILVGFLDMLKGVAAAVMVTRILGFPEYCVIAAAVGGVAGHNWSIFHHFTGGEGVGVTMGVYFFYFPGVMGLLFGIYLLFMGFWALKIKPFYLYHAYNWQSVFCGAPLILYLCGPGWIMDYGNISFKTAFLLTIVLVVSGLVKQIQIHGILFLFKPSDFNNKYVQSKQKSS